MECFEAALTFARAEGIIPAPESSHAIRAAIDEALRAREAGKQTTILFNLSGHGHFDLAAYDSYLHGGLANHEHPQAAIDRALQNLPQVK
jgi:tryptophan synthase beta chain